eukprot:CAMPEP_0172777210 /NCGR_PEP_ID=MMETSP1074-20121228/201284_1 /TAXON_ID=2916 /ORGANISM="Ceratium fusus, Strain PA161109" /LENGTH=122 /DNA_ID=CAMNT_0013614123 /DNA_START=623 /DNA_END=987 /DNA_ORIENTATION=-
MALTWVSNRILPGTFLGLSMLWCSASGSTGGHFLSADGGRVWPQGFRSSEARTHATLEAVLHSNHGATETDVSKIEAILRPTFEAMPRNTVGRLAPRSVRHMIHSYFASQHGLLIQGLEPHG